MLSRQFLAMLSTTTLVAGALLVGDALHGSIVTQQYGVTSPGAVLRFFPGLALIGVGYRLKAHNDAFVEEHFSGRDESGGSEAEFDERMSPLDDEGLDNLQRRDEE
ncbi:hypothetical protein [Halomicrococcus sp. SG-WS-1]|uniref:hypothetical protein n=1 Tax=Halomicrococcus sp. SG-WS-1 TaxID=3439057 RepID=UPI003F7A941F